MRRRKVAERISFFSSGGRLHAEDHVVFADAALGADRAGLFDEAFGKYYHLIFGALRYADGELATRIGIGLPAEFFLAGAADAKLYAGEGHGTVGKDGANNQKICSMRACMFA